MSEDTMADKLYHVLITPVSGTHEPVASYDMDLQRLKDRIISRYESGSPITIAGTTLALASIQRIQVFSSDQNIQALVALGRLSYAARRVASICADYAYLEEFAAECTDEFIVGEPGHKRQASPQAETATEGASPESVFVIHGRNKGVRDSVFGLLRALGLKPLEWEEVVALTGKATPYIFEVIKAGFEHAQAIVAVFSPDDIVVLRPEFQNENDPEYEKVPRGQARPNVIFEAGMAKALNPDRTLIVEVGRTKPFTDVGGMHTVRLGNSATQRKALAQRLVTAGCSVNMAGTDWLADGDFSVDVEMPEAMPRPETAPQKGLGLVFANGLKWERIREGDEARYKPYCPDCEVALKKTMDFVTCPECGFEDLMPQPPRADTPSSA
jgi:predicted nucleotide-binding protein